MSSVPLSLLKDISTISCFNYDDCPICNQKLNKYTTRDDIEIYCINNCYDCYKLTIDNDKNLVFLPHTIRIFGNKIRFFKTVRRIQNNKYYYYDYACAFEYKRKVENMIKYYKYNDRYLAKILIGGR